MTMGTRAEKPIDDLMDEIQTMSDEIRVKIHLAGMDAKTTWRKLEPRLEEAKAHATNATDSSVHALRDLAKALRELGKSI
jgi:hypothetical protein